MLRRFNSASASWHWSKDFVEHLRAVHFALIAVSTGLILLVISAKEYNAVTALVQIEEIIELKRQWSAAFIEDHGEQIKTAWYSPRELRLSVPPFDPEFENMTTHIHWRDPGFLGMITWHSLKGSKLLGAPSRRSVTVRCFFPKQNWYQLSHTTPDWSPDSFPRTLTEFEGWWERLTTPYAVSLPDSMLDSAAVWSQVSAENGWKPDMVGGLSIFRDPEERARRKNLLGPLQLAVPEAGAANVQLSLLKSTTEDNFEYDAAFGDQGSFNIPIITMRQYRVTQGSFSHQFHNLYPGKFQTTFYDLSRATGELADLELDDIKDFIHVEAAKGPEVFEVLGMKFPSGQVTLWGILLLLSVQCYFFSYVRQLSGMLGADDPGWDVPWIGMNPSGLAQSMFWISIVLLPLIASGLLVTRRVTVIFSPLWNDGKAVGSIFKLLDPVQRAQMLVLLLCWIGGLGLGLLTWRYRPLVKENSNSCSPERFE